MPENRKRFRQFYFPINASFELLRLFARRTSLRSILIQLKQTAIAIDNISTATTSPFRSEDLMQIENSIPWYIIHNTIRKTKPNLTTTIRRIKSVYNEQTALVELIGLSPRELGKITSRFSQFPFLSTSLRADNEIFGRRAKVKSNIGKNRAKCESERYK